MCPQVTYRGFYAFYKFIDNLIKKEDEPFGILCESKPMDTSDEETKAIQEATKCNICNKELGEDSICDQCHVTGKVQLTPVFFVT